MPNFTVKDIAPSGSAGLGSFAIETDPAHAPTDGEKAYLAKLKDAQAMLADAHRQDTNFLRSPLHDARAMYREQEVHKLHAIATDFADGKIDADAAANATAEVAQRYAQSCPDLVAQVKAAGVLRFAGDFAITAINYVPDGAVKAYTDRIAYILDTLADDEVADKTPGELAARVIGRQNCRLEAADSLRKEFDEFRQGSIVLEFAADNALVTQGIYIANRDLLKERLFNAIPKLSDDRTRVVALNYYIRPGLPPPDDQPSQEKQDLFVQLSQADTVINTVSRHMDDRAEKIEKRWWYGPKGQRKRRAEAERQLARRLLDQYLTKLHGIAVVGLEGPHTTLAKLGLNELRADFTAQQAGRIKNMYVRSLGCRRRHGGGTVAPALRLHLQIGRERLVV